MNKISKFGVEFQISDHLSKEEFQAVLDTVAFNSVFVKIESELKIRREAAQYYISEAARAAEFGAWNNRTVDEWVDNARDSLNEIPRLLRWSVTQRWSDSDQHGNSYSKMRKDGIIVSNDLLDVNYTFK